MGFGGQSARIVLGRRGLAGGKNPLSLDASSLLQAEGIQFDGEYVSKEPGASRYNATPIAGAPAVVALHDWDATPSNQYLVAATSDGKLYRDDGAGTFGVTLKSGLAPNRVVHIAAGGQEAAALPKKLFVFNGFDPVQVVSGSSPTATDVATPAADWSGTDQPTFGVHHNNRIWAGMRDRLYYNDPTNHEVFQGGQAGQLAVYPGVGQELVGGISAFGRLIVFKRPRGIFWVDDSDLDKANWRLLKLSDGVGLASPWAVIGMEGDVMFKSPEGLYYLLSAVEVTGGLTPAPITNEEDLDVWLRDRVDPGMTRKACMIYHSVKLTAFSSCAQRSSLVNNMVVRYDLKREDIRTAYSFRDRVQSWVMRRQADGSIRLMFGDDAGGVWMAEQDQNNKAGQAYKGQFQLTHNDFSALDAGLAEVRKRAKFVIVHFLPEGSHSMAMDILFDGVYSQTILVPMGSSGAVLDSFVLGSDRLGGNLTTSTRKRIRGGGFRFSAICYNTGLNQDFHVNEIVWQFVVSSRRERKQG